MAQSPGFSIENGPEMEYLKFILCNLWMRAQEELKRRVPHPRKHHTTPQRGDRKVGFIPSGQLGLSQVHTPEVGEKSIRTSVFLTL